MLAGSHIPPLRLHRSDVPAAFGFRDDLEFDPWELPSRHFDFDQRVFPLKTFDVNEDQPATLDVGKIRRESAVVSEFQCDVLDPDAGLAKRAEIFQERPFGFVEFSSSLVLLGQNFV